MCWLEHEKKTVIVWFAKPRKIRSVLTNLDDDGDDDDDDDADHDDDDCFFFHLIQHFRNSPSRQES